MPPVNTSASPSDVDNEATAELPVLDVAAYESTLNDPIAHTDTWVLPNGGLTSSAAGVAETTMEVPAVTPPQKPAYDLDHSGTHEMPPMAKQMSRSARKRARPAAVAAASPVPTLAPTPESEPSAAPAAATAIASPPPDAPQIVLPPSPPLIEELRNALATAERRIEELTERARIADAERAVAVARANAEAAQLREQLAVHLESLQSAKERMGVQRADLPALEDELFARADHIAALEKTQAAHAAVLAEKMALLAKGEQRREALECDVMNLRAAIERRNSQIAILEADMAARQQREAQLSVRLADALASTDPFVPQLRAEIHARDEQVRLLKLDLEMARALAAEKDHDLQVAEESIRNLEIDVRDKNAKLEEVSVTVEEWRAVIAESQRSVLQRDSRIRQLETDLEKRIAVATDSAAQTGEEVALEGPARVLIRTDGNTDYVHVLGRRTRIGRGADNELVLDTKHISRYHAVLLAGPVHTSIEDLNSTNGVFVNGKRVARQVLKDGDRVTIGRTQFRYSVRD
ncbi:MAG TPA: FHA domain-containing protein [Steroidobacteraceae bacterium]|nr:FHA domain-containing protein [Steroidobacteraceae bacterium]